MNCRHAIRLLPLWIGRDLADASEAEAVREHLVKCPDCAAQRAKLQESLEALQTVSTGLLVSGTSGTTRPSLWPGLAMVLGEVPRQRHQFNGWIPAAAMVLAASVMIAVTVNQVQREFADSNSAGFVMSSDEQSADLFQTDEQFQPGTAKRDLRIPGLVKYPSPRNGARLNW